MELREKYLPIGTIVHLKNGKKKLMIIGFRVIKKNRQEEIFDYCGCLYPEGVLTSENMILFNHNQIDLIYYLGYIDEEEKIFNNNLKNMIVE